jgi:hypothetical protein
MRVLTKRQTMQMKQRSDLIKTIKELRAELFIKRAVCVSLAREASDDSADEEE